MVVTPIRQLSSWNSSVRQKGPRDRTNLSPWPIKFLPGDYQFAASTRAHGSWPKIPPSFSIRAFPGPKDIRVSRHEATSRGLALSVHARYRRGAQSGPLVHHRLCQINPLRLTRVKGSTWGVSPWVWAADISRASGISPRTFFLGAPWFANGEFGRATQLMTS